MNELGQFIAAQRMAKNFSIRKLAELSHISHTEIYRLETGERKHPSPFTLKAIANALQISFDEIMQVAGYANNILPSAVVPLIIPGIENLDEKELEEVKDFIDFLLSKRKAKNTT